jgi:hypothetical protein
MLGTADNHLWRRDDDLPLIWAAVEQINESEGFETSATGQRGRAASFITPRLPPNHTVRLVRAVAAVRRLRSTSGTATFVLTDTAATVTRPVPEEKGFSFLRSSVHWTS